MVVCALGEDELVLVAVVKRPGRVELEREVERCRAGILFASGGRLAVGVGSGELGAPKADLFGAAGGGEDGFVGYDDLNWLRA